MKKEREIKVLENSFDVMDKVIPSCVVEDEPTTRKNIKNMINDMLKSASHEDERSAIMEAYAKLNNLTFIELKELKDIAEENSEEEPLYEDELCRQLAYFMEYGTCFEFEDEHGKVRVFSLQLRIAHEGKIYVLLMPIGENKEDELPKSEFYEVTTGISPYEDRMELVTEPNLLNELCEIAADILNGSGDDN